MTENSRQIYQILVDKGTLKQKVFDKTLNTLHIIKDVCKQMETELNEGLRNVPDARVRLKYRNISAFQAELKVAGDLIVFYMHSNIFKFADNHKIWKSKFLKEDPLLSYVGVIHIYNFLADSFKYNRTEDMGYLIARLFVTKQDFFWIENITDTEKVVFNYEPFKTTPNVIRQLIEQVVLFALQFDLETLPYDMVKLTTVKEIIEARKIGAPTGKKLGFSTQEHPSQIQDKIIYSGG